MYCFFPRTISCAIAPGNASFQFDSADVRAKATFGDAQIDFKVSSHAMSFASPVWKKFIFPPFPRLAESPTTRGGSAQKKKKKTDEAFPDVELDFTEDNGDALLILLQIAHLHLHISLNDFPTKLC
jgi:hypothetical protein